MVKNQRILWYAIGGALILFFLAYGATSFKSNLTPYVSFDEAMKTASRVQVAGALVEDSSNYVGEARELRFRICDEAGTEMPVRYSGVKPANFEEATQIVAVGSWSGDAFDAEQLLVKCPSKYQGVDSDLTNLARTSHQFSWRDARDAMPCWVFRDLTDVGVLDSS